jgi:hypothetical protein
MFVDLPENRDQQVLVPELQSTLTFHEKPLIAVRLANGDHGVVLRWICENLHLDVTAQIQRIKRTEVIADDLLYVRIQTAGGPQVMPTLLLRAVPYWLATIDTRRSSSTSAMRLMHCIVGHNPSEARDVLDSSSQNRSKSQPLPIKMQVCNNGTITMNKWLLLRRGASRWKNGVEQWRTG